jgi:phosphatidate cytidylyltransferase
VNLTFDQETLWLVCGVTGLLVIASMVGYVLSRTVKSESGRKTVQNLNARTRAWWMMVAIFGVALATGGIGTILLFAFTSFLALREFITLTPTRRGDHRALFWIFFIFTPLQYLLLWRNWYELFTIFIPVFAFLFIPVRSAISGDCERFLERAAKIQWALMICVYCLSHAPALLQLEIPGYTGQNAKLLFFFVLVAQISDVLQYVWGKTLGKHKIVPNVSPNKTWAGFVGGIGSATLIGALMWWITPFTPGQAAAMSLVICIMGFAGGLVMSAIKRDRGIKDFGTMIEGHGGVLDRIDSICFAAPVFFHLTRHYFTGSLGP